MAGNDCKLAKRALAKLEEIHHWRLPDNIRIAEAVNSHPSAGVRVSFYSNWRISLNAGVAELSDIRDAAKYDPDPRVRMAAARCLNAFPDWVLEPLAVDALTAPTSQERASAVASLRNAVEGRTRQPGVFWGAASNPNWGNNNIGADLARLRSNTLIPSPDWSVTSHSTGSSVPRALLPVWAIRMLPWATWSLLLLAMARAISRFAFSNPRANYTEQS